MKVGRLCLSRPLPALTSTLCHAVRVRGIPKSPTRWQAAGEQGLCQCEGVEGEDRCAQESQWELPEEGYIPWPLLAEPSQQAEHDQSVDADQSSDPGHAGMQDLDPFEQLNREADVAVQTLRESGQTEQLVEVIRKMKKHMQKEGQAVQGPQTSEQTVQPGHSPADAQHPQVQALTSQARASGLVPDLLHSSVGRHTRFEDPGDDSAMADVVPEHASQVQGVEAELAQLGISDQAAKVPVQALADTAR